ncbi:MAG: hypothetical protein ACNS64_00155 [Candidatus Halalkalibacterium sp. M3_1C_030]
MALEEEGRDNILHERVSMLQKEGYRGFTLKNIKKKWDGVSVTVKNSQGRTFTESGETTEEAGKKVIDKIDTLMD